MIGVLEEHQSDQRLGQMAASIIDAGAGTLYLSLMNDSPTSSSELSVREFFKRFPDDEACLEYIMIVRFGGTRFNCRKCGVDAKYYKLKKLRVYCCGHCGHHISPTAGTILHDTYTPLVSWFYAIYLLCTTPHGPSGKELKCQLGVTYKTAYRIRQKIRHHPAKAGLADLLRSQI
ncbi:MAG: IS1595 family transposase [Hyphomicrobiales bacterium]|nr:MAG: IS1595 family transposase [Hyphomicrobiales bacterium]